MGRIESVGIGGTLADLWSRYDNALLVVLDMVTEGVDRAIDMEQMNFRLRGKVECIAVDTH